MAAKPMSVNGRFFRTKEALKSYIRSIVKKYDNNEPLEPDDLQFMLVLLERHRWRDQKVGVGVMSMTVREIPPHFTKGFSLTRYDGTSTEFSWVECVSPPSQRQDVFTAMRTAIADQKAAFRRAFFSSTVNPRCPITGELLEESTCHVDHESPLTFNKIATDFLVNNLLDVETIALEGYGDNEATQSLKDDLIRQAWSEYHRHNVKLRVLSAKGHLSLGK